MPMIQNKLVSYRKQLEDDNHQPTNLHEASITEFNTKRTHNCPSNETHQVHRLQNEIYATEVLVESPKKTEVSVESLKLTNPEPNEIEPSTNDFMEVYNILRTTDNSQAQLNRPDGVS